MSELGFVVFVIVNTTVSCFLFFSCQGINAVGGWMEEASHGHLFPFGRTRRTRMDESSPSCCLKHHIFNSRCRLFQLTQIPVKC